MTPPPENCRVKMCWVVVSLAWSMHIKFHALGLLFLVEFLVVVRAGVLTIWWAWELAVNSTNISFTQSSFWPKLFLTTPFLTKFLWPKIFLTKHIWPNFFEKYYFDQKFSDPILTIFFVFLKTFFDQYFIYQNISMKPKFYCKNKCFSWKFFHLTHFFYPKNDQNFWPTFFWPPIFLYQNNFFGPNFFP